jgi:1,4-alpha-glucan branching enzyme
VEGRTDPGLANQLATTVPLADLAQMGEEIAQLVEFPGWATLMGLLDEAVETGQERLARDAQKAALSTDPKDAVAFAQKAGIHLGLRWVPDAVETVLEKAKAAAERLRNDAERDTPAEEVT